jgi:hypothetical protein
MQLFFVPELPFDRRKSLFGNHVFNPAAILFGHIRADPDGDQITAQNFMPMINRVG